MPVISSLAAIAIVWQFAYNGDFGLINQVLAWFGIDGPDWLQNTATVKPAIIIMAIWKGLGYSMLLYLAAIQSRAARPSTRPRRSTAPTPCSGSGTSPCRWSGR